jgi:hypothetical protein
MRLAAIYNAADSAAVLFLHAGKNATTKKIKTRFFILIFFNITIKSLVNLSIYKALMQRTEACAINPHD